MLKFLDRFQEESRALLRIVAGLMFSLHGMQKLFGFLGATPVELASQMGVGGVIELTTGLAIMLGVLARPAAFLASGQMAVAYLQFHWRFRMGSDFFPVFNHGELALLYSFVFLTIATHGAGVWALLPGHSSQEAHHHEVGASHAL